MLMSSSARNSVTRSLAEPGGAEKEHAGDKPEDAFGDDPREESGQGLDGIGVHGCVSGLEVFSRVSEKRAVLRTAAKQRSIVAAGAGRLLALLRFLRQR